MKKYLSIILLGSFILAQNIVETESYAQFKVRNMGVRDVYGTITGMQGIVDFRTQNPDSAYFEVTIAVNTIDTENPKRDAHLKNEDFFETDKWPTIHFKSKKISKQDELYGVFGYLTIKDVTREVFVPFSVEETKDQIIFKGGETINRLDYNVGVEFDTFKIGNKIDVDVICVFNKK